MNHAIRRTPRGPSKTSVTAFAFLIAASLAGCASTKGSASTPEEASPGGEAAAADPFEGFNRAMFAFNDKVDQVALKPTAQVYRDYIPSFVQTGVGNFFGNIGDVWSTANLFLQGKVEHGLNSFMRVAVNTTFGLGGVLDVAGEAGISRRSEDFGQTLGYWGLGSGPYVVLPLFGPSTVRDTAAFPVDAAGNLWSYTSPEAWRIGGSVVRVVDRRAELLGASNLLEDVALDRYQFVRDTYLQRRASQVRDGGSGDDNSDVNSEGRELLIR